MKTKVCILTMVALLAAASVGAQNPPKNAPPPPQQKPESLLHRVLRISGIAASPTALKGPGDEVRSGQVWLVEVATKKRQCVTPGGGFRSPVIAPDGADIIALRGDDVVRIHRSGGSVEKVDSIEAISKLVGFSEDDVDKILVLTAGASGSATIGLLSLGTGKVQAVPYDKTSAEDRQTLEDLRGWVRVYGNKRLYVKRQSKESVSGRVEWTDVFLKEREGEAVDISECGEVNCGQPSLSADGRFVVFVKSDH